MNKTIIEQLHGEEAFGFAVAAGVPFEFKDSVRSGDKIIVTMQTIPCAVMRNSTTGEVKVAMMGAK